MKKTKDGFRAHELELIVAPDADGFNNRKLYVLEGVPGIYRRLTVENGNANAETVKAWFDGGIIPLLRVEWIEKELDEAGFHSRCLGWTIATDPANVLFTNAPAKPVGLMRDGVATIGPVKRSVVESFAELRDVAEGRCSVVPDQQRLIDEGSKQRNVVLVDGPADRICEHESSVVKGECVDGRPDLFEVPSAP